MTHTFRLDWRTDALIGFQKYVCREAVDSLVRGIDHMDHFSPVVVRPFLNPFTGELHDLTGYCTNDSPHSFPCRNVWVLDEQAFIPSLRTRDGGHHRAIAHYLRGVPLLCRFLEPGEPIAVQSFDDPAFQYRFIYEIPVRENVLMPSGSDSEWNARRIRHNYTR